MPERHLGIGAADVASLPREALPGLLAEVQMIRVAVFARMLAAPGLNGGGPSGEDEMLSAAEAAKRTGMSRRWLYAEAKAGHLPFARRVAAHGVRFSARGIARWLATRKA